MQLSRPIDSRTQSSVRKVLGGEGCAVAVSNHNFILIENDNLLSGRLFNHMVK